MLYIVVILAAVFYVALFAAWDTFRPQMESSAHALSSWRDVIFSTPDPNSLLLLKEVLVIAIAYLIVDACVSGVRRLVKQRATPQSSWKNHKIPDYSEPL